jgi:hypothetical protein
MALAAAQVVDALAARLVGTASAVHTDRAWPVAQAALPVWKVYATDENIDTQSLDGIEQHELTVECRGLVAATTGLDDALNNLAAAGLTALHASPYTRITLQTAGLARQMASEGGADVAVVTLRMRAVFYTNQQAPETLI